MHVQYTPQVLIVPIITYQRIAIKREGEEKEKEEEEEEEED